MSGEVCPEHSRLDERINQIEKNEELLFSKSENMDKSINVEKLNSGVFQATMQAGVSSIALDVKEIKDTVSTGQKDIVQNNNDIEKLASTVTSLADTMKAGFVNYNNRVVIVENWQDTFDREEKKELKKQRWFNKKTLVVFILGIVSAIIVSAVGFVWST